MPEKFMRIWRGSPPEEENLLIGKKVPRRQEHHSMLTPRSVGLKKTKIAYTHLEMPAQIKNSRSIGPEAICPSDPPKEHHFKEQRHKTGVAWPQVYCFRLLERKQLCTRLWKKQPERLRKIPEIYGTNPGIVEPGKMETLVRLRRFSGIIRST
jgi:hypothetical protein